MGLAPAFHDMAIIEIIVFGSLIVLLSAYEIVLLKKLCSQHKQEDTRKIGYYWYPGFYVPRI